MTTISGSGKDLNKTEYFLFKLEMSEKAEINQLQVKDTNKVKSNYTCEKIKI